MGKIRKNKTKNFEKNTTPPKKPENQLELLIDKNDDTKSTKSLKLLKTELGIRQISKVNKMKLRQKMFLKRIGAVPTKTKKVNAARDDILNDRLPSLSSLLVSTTDRIKVPEARKKPVAKSKRRQKNVTEGVRFYRNIVRGDDFKKNPIECVLRHVKTKIDAV